MECGRQHFDDAFIEDALEASEQTTPLDARTEPGQKLTARFILRYAGGLDQPVIPHFYNQITVGGKYPDRWLSYGHRFVSRK